MCPSRPATIARRIACESGVRRRSIVARIPDVLPGFDPDADPRPQPGGTFVFGLSGGLAAVRDAPDVFGVVVLAGRWAGRRHHPRPADRRPPATFRDWRYLAAAGAAGLLPSGAAVGGALQRRIDVLDAVGLALFCVTGATKALDFRVGPVPAILLGAITGIGGGILRDVLLNEVPTVLRRELYAVPALLGASVVVVASKAGSHSAVFPLLGMLVCFVVRLVGLRRDVNLPSEPPEAMTRRAARRRGG